MNKPIENRILEYKIKAGFKDEKGQSHFPNSKLNIEMSDVVKLGKSGGYWPKK